LKNLEKEKEEKKYYVSENEYKIYYFYKGIGMCTYNSKVKLIKGLKFKFGIQNKKETKKEKEKYKRKRGNG
jgi:hypothetical protein